MQVFSNFVHKDQVDFLGPPKKCRLILIILYVLDMGIVAFWSRCLGISCTPILTKAGFTKNHVAKCLLFRTKGHNIVLVYESQGIKWEMRNAAFLCNLPDSNPILTSPLCLKWNIPIVHGYCWKLEHGHCVKLYPQTRDCGKIVLLVILPTSDVFITTCTCI